MHNLKLERQSTNDRLTKIEDEVRSMKAFLSVNNPFQQYSQQFNATNSNLTMNDQMKRNNMSLNYGVINSTAVDGPAPFDEHHQNYYQRLQRTSQSPTKRHENLAINENDDDSHVIQLEKDTVKLRRDLQDALAGRKQAESRVIAYV
jgi:hypothetical protein